MTRQTLAFTVLRPLVLLLVCAAGTPAADDSDHGGRVIRLPWHIYRHYPADFSRWHEAAAGFRGWEAEERELDLDRCCLVLKTGKAICARPCAEDAWRSRTAGRREELAVRILEDEHHVRLCLRSA